MITATISSSLTAAWLETHYTSSLLEMELSLSHYLGTELSALFWWTFALWRLGFCVFLTWLDGDFGTCIVPNRAMFHLTNSITPNESCQTAVMVLNQKKKKKSNSFLRCQRASEYLFLPLYAFCSINELCPLLLSGEISRAEALGLSYFLWSKQKP